MNAPLRRVGVVTLVLFALLFVNLNYRQASWKADEYRNSDYNGRVQVAQYERPRGKIINAQGVAIADAQETTDTLKYLRVYPFKEQYAHIVGYKPVNLAATDLEKLQNAFLFGESDLQAGERFLAQFTGKEVRGGNVLLTLSQATQEKAFAELVNNKKGVKQGAIVAMDPSTGALLASVSMPSYDPNLLSGHDTKAAEAAYRRLEADPGRPLANRALSERYPPGSTFKVITSAAALEADPSLNGSSTVQGGEFYNPPAAGSFRIKNARQGICPEQISLKQALTVSCNTVYARLAVERVGADKLKDMARAFGFESEPRLIEDQKDNNCGVAASVTGAMTSGPENRVDPPVLAQSAIGQQGVQMTPLQGAMIAATVANDGRLMRPYVIDRLQNADLSNADRTQPKEIRKPIKESTARDLQDQMISVVSSGTGRNANGGNGKLFPGGLQVGGKTGTAEDGEEAADHGWFIGFVMKDGKPVVAVAVFLENAGQGGSGEAARIGGQVMKAYVDEKGIK